MQWKVIFESTFETSFEKLIAPEIRPQVRQAIHWRLSRNPLDHSIKWPPQAKADLRADFIFVGQNIGWIRIFFEIRNGEIVVWSVGKGKSGRTE